MFLVTRNSLSDLFGKFTELFSLRQLATTNSKHPWDSASPCTVLKLKLPTVLTFIGV